MRSTTETLAWLRGECQSPSKSWYQLCLALTRTARGIDPMYASAIQAWHGAKHKHPLTSGANWSKVPVGAPIYYHSSTYGHIVTFAGVTNAGPLCYTNDVAGHGKVSMVSPLWFISHWRQPILGWTEDINGARISFQPPKPIKPNPTNTVSLRDAVKAATLDPPRPTQSKTAGAGPDVRLIEEALASKNLLDKKHIDGHYGSTTIEAYKKWQRKLGYVGKDADGIPGKVSLQRLADGQPWRVVA